MNNRTPLTWRQALLAAAIGAAALVMVGLGIWQLGRLQQRRALNAEAAASLAQPPLELTGDEGPLPAEYTPVVATGVYDPDQEIVLRNRARLDSPGVHVLTPLRLAGSESAVMVDRGWLPYTEADPGRRAAYAPPAGEVTVRGIIRPSQARAAPFLPADPTLSPDQPRLDAWYWVNLDEIQSQVPYRLMRVYIEAEAGPAPSQLPVSGYEVDLSDGPHLSYAIQWFAFAAILVVGSWGLWRRRSSRPSGR